jgi:1-acyl-sn-glycerol-3-phosphate acyltransferase
MRARQNVLVYPGGAAEVMKHSSIPKYDLMWKERLGFARLAIKHGYPIVPCCAVGMEDMMDIVMDVPVPYKGMTVPVVTTAPHRLQKIYIWFGKPISTVQYQGEFTNTEFCIELRDRVKRSVEEGIRLMRKKQESDPTRFLSQQVRNALKSTFPSVTSFADDVSYDGFESDDNKMD